MDEKRRHPGRLGGHEDVRTALAKTSTDLCFLPLPAFTLTRDLVLNVSGSDGDKLVASRVAAEKDKAVKKPALKFLELRRGLR